MPPMYSTPTGIRSRSSIRASRRRRPGPGGRATAANRSPIRSRPTRPTSRAGVRHRGRAAECWPGWWRRHRPSAPRGERRTASCRSPGSGSRRRGARGRGAGRARSRGCGGQRRAPGHPPRAASPPAPSRRPAAWTFPRKRDYRRAASGPVREAESFSEETFARQLGPDPGTVAAWDGMNSAADRPPAKGIRTPAYWTATASRGMLGSGSPGRASAPSAFNRKGERR